MNNCSKDEYIERFRKYNIDISQNCIRCNINNLKEVVSKISCGIRTRIIVQVDGVDYDFLVMFDNKSDKTICIGSGAYDGRDFEFMQNNLTLEERIEHAKLPKYDRWSWDFKMNMIFYNDTTRNFIPENLLLCGWLVGNEKQWHLDVVKKIICSILEYRKLLESKTVFYGTSVGGFTSLMLSTLVKGSLCIADVPQLDLTNKQGYFEQVVSHKVVKDVSFWDNIMYRLKLFELIKREQYVPKAFINITFNRIDVINQYNKFMEQMSLNEDLFKNNIYGFKFNVIPSQRHASIGYQLLMKELEQIFNIEFSSKDDLI